MANEALRILVVDDSALFRQHVQNVLRGCPQAEVVGVAKSGDEALRLVESLAPDLLTLDVRMPGMDGIEVLRELRRRRSTTKVIMLSSLTAAGAQVTTEALLEGAFDFILKPATTDAAVNRQMLQQALLEKISAVRSSSVPRLGKIKSATAGTRSGDAESAPSTKPFQAVVMGTSTGGPVALREVLPAFPEDFPVPILIVQHMPAQYTHSLAERLNESSPLEVVEGCAGMILEPGWAYIAPGGRHMQVTRRAGNRILKITDDPPENGCRPSVDVLFRSVAKEFDGNVLAIIMTGMGRDGVEGCRLLKERGAYIIAEHADSCVVYGMPKAVADENLADAVVPLSQITATVVRRVQRAR